MDFAQWLGGNFHPLLGDNQHWGEKRFFFLKGPIQWWFQDFVRFWVRAISCLPFLCVVQFFLCFHGAAFVVQPFTLLWKFGIFSTVTDPGFIVFALGSWLAQRFFQVLCEFTLGRPGGVWDFLALSCFFFFFQDFLKVCGSPCF